MGYIVDFQYSQFFNNLTLNLSSLSCNFYFSDLYFDEDSSIRVDNQGNAWITTNDGIRVIKSKEPKNPGTGQRNLQIVSSLNGIKATDTHFVVKMRYIPPESLVDFEIASNTA